MSQNEQLRNYGCLTSSDVAVVAKGRNVCVCCQVALSQGAFKAVVNEKKAKDPGFKVARVTKAWPPVWKSRPCFLSFDEASVYWLLATA